MLLVILIRLLIKLGGSPLMLFRAAGEWYLNGSETSTGHSTFTTNDVIGVALDLDRNIITWYKNGSQLFQYTSVSSSVNAWIPAWKDSDSGGNAVANWGQKPFKYAPPQGFLPLNSATARSETVIARPDRYIQVLKYTGDDATTHPITGLNFGAVPDFVWIKNRNQSEKHILHDTVRGVGDTLYSTSNDHDTGSTYSDRYKSFDLNGFTVGSTHTSTNSDGDDFSAVCWKMEVQTHLMLMVWVMRVLLMRDLMVVI